MLSSALGTALNVYGANINAHATWIMYFGRKALHASRQHDRAKYTAGKCKQLSTHGSQQRVEGLRPIPKTVTPTQCTRKMLLVSLRTT